MEKEIGEKKRKEKKGERERREKEEREASISLYDLRRLVGWFSSSQELKFICSTKAKRGYRKHEISSRIQVKSSGNQGFRGLGFRKCHQDFLEQLILFKR